MESNSNYPLTDLQSMVVVVLLGTFLAALIQFKNQFELYRKTPNSEQRKLCFAGATFTLAGLAFFLGLFFVYVGELANGLPTGRQPAGEWPLAISLLSLCSFVMSYLALLFIIFASLHRYYRLCAVEEGSNHEKMFLVAKHGSIAFTVLSVACSFIKMYLFRGIILAAIHASSILWLIGVDFYANFSASLRTFANIQMISRVLKFYAASSNADGDIRQADWIKKRRDRKTLRLKLMIYFGLGLVVNLINLVLHTLAGTFLVEFFIELSLLNGSAGALYLVLNLYFLDVLRDGVLTPDPPIAAPQRVNLNTERGKKHPDRVEIHELVDRSPRIVC
jgi:hypothetical protein